MPETSKQIIIGNEKPKGSILNSSDNFIAKKINIGFLKKKQASHTPKERYLYLKLLTEAGNEIGNGHTQYTSPQSKVFRIPDPRDPNEAENTSSNEQVLKANPLLADTPYADGAAPDNNNEAISAEANIEAQENLEEAVKDAELSPALRAKLENKLQNENKKRLERVNTITPRPY